MTQRRKPEQKQTLGPLLRGVIETGFIVFLFYSNLLMGEFTRANMAKGKTLTAAIKDVVTVDSLAIAIFSALVGYVVVEYLRRRL
jgi:hypothetical protein